MRHVFAVICACLALCWASAPALAQDHEPDHNPAHDPTQHNPVAPPAHDPNAQVPGAKDKKDAPAEPSAPGPLSADEEEFPEHEPLTMKVGLILEHIAKFDVSTGSFTIEAEVTVTCDKPCDPAITLANGRLTGKLEGQNKGKGKALVHKWKMKGEVDGFIDFSEFPFDSHVLEIEVANKSDPVHTTVAIDHEHTHAAKRVKVPGYEIMVNAEVAGEGGKPDDIYMDTAVVPEDDGDGQIEQHAVFAIHLEKAKLPAVVKSIVPLVAMLFGVGIGLLLRPKSIGTRFGAAAGGLVPLVTFHVAQVITLPQGTGLTRFDKFMVMTYIVYLVHHCFNVAILRSEEVKNENRSQKLYLVSAGLVPGLALVLWLLVFLKFI